MTFATYYIDDWASKNIEYLGTKPKAWYTNPNGLTQEERKRLYLFKEARPNTGEDWSEKIACELAARMGLPHAQYELATHSGKRGVISPNFLPPVSGLVLGNEVLRKIVPDYAGKARYERRGHTLNIVCGSILKAKLPIDWTLPENISIALDVFVGYLLFDAWICNADRHDENWGFVAVQSAPGQDNATLYLAPTFDHASCLGRELTDERRAETLTTKDKNRTVQTYIENCRSGFFASDQEKKTMKALDAFKWASAIRPLAAKSWLERLKEISETEVAALFDQVPSDLISAPAIDFGIKVLMLGKERLLAI